MTKNREDYDSIFMKNIQKGLDKNIINISADDSKITYHCKRVYTTSFKNPEEKVRASYFSELVLDYDYPQKNIDIEVIVPRRKPEDRADIVIYDEDGAEYLVIECKKDGITDAEFKQAIEQVFGNANSMREQNLLLLLLASLKLLLMLLDLSQAKERRMSFLIFRKDMGKLQNISSLKEILIET